jgi:hypothetical protein
VQFDLPASYKQLHMEGSGLVGYYPVLLCLWLLMFERTMSPSSSSVTSKKASILSCTTLQISQLAYLHIRNTFLMLCLLKTKIISLLCFQKILAKCYKTILRCVIPIVCRINQTIRCVYIVKHNYIVVFDDIHIHLTVWLLQNLQRSYWLFGM